MSFTKVTSAGIGSTELVTLDSLEVINNASIGGVLTYEDVTNVDSVGIITARAGVLVGSGITLSKDGDIFVTGISTFQGITATTATLTGNADVEGGLVVGNGIAAPLSGFSAHFHAAATSNRIQLTTSNTGVTATDGAVIMIDSSSNMEILNRENTSLEFFTNNTQYMTLDNAGRLLLGTTTEGHSLSLIHI